MSKSRTHQWSLAGGNAPSNCLHTGYQRFDETATVDNWIARRLNTKPARCLSEKTHTYRHTQRPHYHIYWLPIEWRIRFKLATLTFKALHTGCHHISLTSCNNNTNINNPRGLCAHPVLISFQTPTTIWHLNLVLFGFALQEFGIHYCQYPWIPVPSYFQTSSKDIWFSVSLPPFSCPPCLVYLRPCTLILLRPWHYISHVLNYLHICRLDLCLLFR